MLKTKLEVKYGKRYYISSYNEEEIGVVDENDNQWTYSNWLVHIENVKNSVYLTHSDKIH